MSWLLYYHRGCFKSISHHCITWLLIFLSPNSIFLTTYHLVPRLVPHILCIIKSSPCFWYQFLYSGSNLCIFQIWFSINNHKIPLIYNNKHLFFALITIWQRSCASHILTFWDARRSDILYIFCLHFSSTIYILSTFIMVEGKHNRASRNSQCVFKLLLVCSSHYVISYAFGQSKSHG